MNRAIRMSITAMLTLLASFGLACVASPASADASCGAGKFVESIELVQWGDDQFQVILTPTNEARRHAALALNPRDAVVDQWYAIQRCVPGLYEGLADTIWDQLECHQLNSWLILPREDGIWATGSAYELESWRPTLPRWVNGQDLIVTECLNRLGTDPSGPFSSPFRPGEIDLHHAWSNVA